jgi:hypothetical protein
MPTGDRGRLEVRNDQKPRPEVHVAFAQTAREEGKCHGDVFGRPASVGVERWRLGFMILNQLSCKLPMQIDVRQ